MRIWPITWYESYNSVQHDKNAALKSSRAKGGYMSTMLMQARRECEGDSFISSTESRCIQSFQSSFDWTWDVSHAVFRCCWLTVILVASAGAENSGGIVVPSCLLNMYFSTLTKIVDRKLTNSNSSALVSCGKRSPFKSLETRLSYLEWGILFLTKHYWMLISVITSQL